MTMVIHLLGSALILMLIAYVLPGVAIQDFGVALLAAIVLGLVNFFIRPVVSLLTLPINILTLGFFSLVINGAMFGLAAMALSGFEVTDFWSALLGAFLFSILTTLLGVNGKTPKNREVS